MQLIVTSGDQNGSGHLVEAGFDDFEVTGDLISSTEDIALAGLQAAVFPNPSQSGFNFQYQLPSAPTNDARIEITDLMGRNVSTTVLDLNSSGQLQIGEQLPAGAYFARLIVDGSRAYSTKLIKQ